jgi:hypothetical protein
MRPCGTPIWQPESLQDEMVRAVCPKGKNRCRSFGGRGHARRKRTGRCRPRRRCHQAAHCTARSGQVGRLPDDHLFPPGVRAVFAYGFAKSDRANIDADEEKQFKEAARHVLRLTEKQIEELVNNGDFVEVRYEQEVSK